MGSTKSILLVGVLFAVILISLLAYNFLLSDKSTTILHRGNARFGVHFSESLFNLSLSNEADHELKKGPQFFPSKSVIIRAVYYDDRPRDGHQNAAVFLVMVWKNITDNNWVTGCQVGEYSAMEYGVNVIGETPKWRVYKSYNKIDHEEVLVDCFDIQDAHNGMDGYLFYKASKDGEVEMAVSERPLVIPIPHIPPKSPESSKYNFTVMTCTKIFDRPPWLQEWLEYQRTIGVDHVHMNMDDSFIRHCSREDLKYLGELINDGFLSADLWVLWLENGKEIWYHNQGLILEDCVYQFRTTYDHMFILDTDDFFTPRVPGETKVHYYIDKYCREKYTGSCKFRWIEFYPDHYHLRDTPTVGGNITDRVLNFTHYIQPNRKSMHRPNTVIDSATHHAHKLIKDYHIKEVHHSIAYVAHVRKGKHPDFDKSHSIVSVAGMP